MLTRGHLLALSAFATLAPSKLSGLWFGPPGACFVLTLPLSPQSSRPAMR